MALHRFTQPMTTSDLKDLQQTLLWPACVILPSKALHRHALALHEETGYRFYDCQPQQKAGEKSGLIPS